MPVDIAQACELLIQFTEGRTFQEYSNDALLQSGVERQFEIIGEALNQALRFDPSLAVRISDSRRIIAFRNLLIHAYGSVSDEVVWGIVETNLPNLRLEVTAILRELD